MVKRYIVGTIGIAFSLYSMDKWLSGIFKWKLCALIFIAGMGLLVPAYFVNALKRYNKSPVVWFGYICTFSCLLAVVLVRSRIVSWF